MKKVWTFTNQKSLNKKEFIDYFERKIFRTIRKYQMLPRNKVIILKKDNSLNTIILKEILETKFQVKFGPKANISSDNLSQVAEDIFKDILRGKFEEKIKKDKPLMYLSDKEVELYAGLKDIKGVKRKKDKKIQLLFDKFLKKNQDLELNIVKAIFQLDNKS
jgi:hypothetical protein